MDFFVTVSPTKQSLCSMPISELNRIQDANDLENSTDVVVLKDSQT